MLQAHLVMLLLRFLFLSKSIFIIITIYFIFHTLISLRAARNPHPVMTTKMNKEERDNRRNMMNNLN